MNTPLFSLNAMTALFLAAAVVFSPARSYGQEASEASRKVSNRVSPPEIPSAREPGSPLNSTLALS
jgi:hypothetical protein